MALDYDPERIQEAAKGNSSVHYGDARRGDLLRAIGLDRARTSRALTGLVQKKLVRRIPRPGDRREVMLQLTDDGRAVHARLLPRVAHINRQLLSVLSQEEAGQLSDLLTRLAVQARVMGGLPEQHTDA